MTSVEIILIMTGVKKIEEFMGELRLRWFGHVEKMDNKRIPVKTKNSAVGGSKKGRPKKDGKK